MGGAGLGRPSGLTCIGQIEKGLDVGLPGHASGPWGRGWQCLWLGPDGRGKWRPEQGRMAWARVLCRLASRDPKWSICFLMKLTGRGRKRDGCHHCRDVEGHEGACSQCSSMGTARATLELMGSCWWALAILVEEPNLSHLRPCKDEDLVCPEGLE